MFLLDHWLIVFRKKNEATCFTLAQWFMAANTDYRYNTKAQSVRYNYMASAQLWHMTFSLQSHDREVYF
jgi:hypothetical protein